MVESSKNVEIRKLRDTKASEYSPTCGESELKCLRGGGGGGNNSIVELLQYPSTLSYFRDPLKYQNNNIATIK